MTKQDKKRLSALSQVIFDKKGFNILVLDVRGVSTMTDYFIIAEGSVARHVKSIGAAIKHEISNESLTLYHIEGEQEGDWIVIDSGEVVIHLFTPDMREKYSFEELWNKAKIVDVDINVSAAASKASSEKF